ncbi:MAG: hypothetical protein EZS28_007687 [Streblomastix strix]|uniref:Uncharacterized protein n=1 Tax=Streblomastix strix TaxID=222440 RepID=A0A5J4WQ06_9EUKA|nr:MAG: hypothetical protein EZS28_007687 [Streblomastix strix]
MQQFSVDETKLDSVITSVVDHLFVQWQKKTGAALSFPHTSQQSDIFQLFGILRVQSPTGQNTSSGRIVTSRHRYMSPQSTSPQLNNIRSPSFPQSPNGSTNAQQLLSDRDMGDCLLYMDYSCKKTEDELEQLQDENSDLKVKVAFFEKEIKGNDDENAQYKKEIIVIQDECRWRELEKLDIQKKVKQEEDINKEKENIIQMREKTIEEVVKKQNKTESQNEFKLTVIRSTYNKIKF